MNTSIDQHLFIALDTETTGLTVATDRIIEICAIKFKLFGQILSSFEQLMDPKIPINPDALAVHGISHKMLDGHPPEQTVLPRFLDFLGQDAVLIAHNKNFDLGFLQIALRRLNLPELQNKTIDTLALSRSYFPQLPNHKLQTVARFSGFNPAQYHRAANDCLALKAIIEHLLRQHPELDTLEKILKPKQTHAPLLLQGTLPSPDTAILQKALSQASPVWICYQGGSKSGDRKITPYSIEVIAGIHFIRAFCHIDQIEKNFKLDRILSIREQNPAAR